MHQGVRVSSAPRRVTAPAGSLLAAGRAGNWVHPRFRALPPPVIVIGMHRSGTSMVAGLLHQLGVYMGPELDLPGSAAQPGEMDARKFRDGYAEAQDFRQLNDRLLSRAGATWCRVQRFVTRRDDPWLHWRGLTEMGLATHGALRSGYLRGMEAGYQGAWGWKDPRTSLTLPYWLQLFPRAAVVHVRREEAKVVESLVRRALTPPTGPPMPPEQRLRHWLRDPATTLRRGCHRLLTGKPMPPPVDPCRDPEFSRELARTYLRECLRNRDAAARCHEVWYEDVLEDPQREVLRLAAFLQAQPSTAVVRAATALVRK